MIKNPPRMTHWLVLYLMLFIGAYLTKEADPQSLLAVTFYKAHLLALGGWLGYWLDRALFPYDRPHQYLEPEGVDDFQYHAELEASMELVAANAFQLAMMRRALICAACTIAVGLGA